MKHVSPHPETDVDLSEYDPDFTHVEEELAKSTVPSLLAQIENYAAKLYAENKQSLLIVLQAMDTAGKDGTIKHVMSGMNPLSCNVVCFKQPSEEELDHHYLWRIQRQLPRRGNVTVFNRSHYEDVLVVRVHEFVEKKVWEKRYDEINRFEEDLVNQGTAVLKFFLHISKDEQAERIRKRLEDPNKNWKFSRSDLEERKYWDHYQRAYEDVLTKCNTEHAPWFVIPANKKWHRNFMVTSILADKLKKMDPKFPKPKEDLSKIVVV